MKTCKLNTRRISSKNRPWGSEAFKLGSFLHTPISKDARDGHTQNVHGLRSKGKLHQNIQTTKTTGRWPTYFSLVSGNLCILPHLVFRISLLRGHLLFHARNAMFGHGGENKQISLHCSHGKVVKLCCQYKRLS